MSDLSSLFNEYHLRVTIQRSLIIKYLMSHKDHPTAEIIYKYMKTKIPHISKATIYNNLNQLVEVGIVHTLRTGDGNTYYDYFHEPHYHLVCVKCGKIVDINYDSFKDDEKRIMYHAQNKGFRILNDNIEVYGICDICQNKKI